MLHTKSNEHVTFGADVMAVAHEPGDGTRYEIRLVKVGERETMIALLNARGGYGRAMVLPEHELTPPASYIAEKMGLNEYDAGVIERYLKLIYSK